MDYVMTNYGYTEEAAFDYCFNTPDSQYGCADSCEDAGDDGSADDGGDAGACEECLESCMDYVMTNYGYTEDQAREWCSTTPDSQYGCADSCELCSDITGDLTNDGDLNILDVIFVVDLILDQMSDPCADFNGDGNINVIDVIGMVDVIIAGRTSIDATRSSLDISGGLASLDADGYIGAVEMRLTHGSNFSIELTDESLISEYRTSGNTTTLIIVAPESSELFRATGDFNLEIVTVANSNSYVDVEMPSNISLSKAYPNPFNPSTTFSVYLPAEGFVSLSVYNVMGQLVDVIQKGNMSEGYNSVTWNASDMTSGVYFVRAEALNDVAVQKVMLMK